MQRIDRQRDSEVNETQQETAMLIDRYDHEDVLARVPEVAQHSDPVLVAIDRLLDDDMLFAQVRADLVRRYPRTGQQGRHSTPVEVILRMLVVKRLYNWRYEETEERVADSLVLRWFCRVSFQRGPDDTTLIRWAKTIQPATLHTLNDRVVQLAQQARVTQGRKLRLDGTVGQTSSHHPTDSSLLVDSVRVLSRLIRRSKPVVGDTLAGVRDAFRPRLRTMRRALQSIHRTVRQKGQEAAEQRRVVYAKLVATTQQTLRQAERVRQALVEVGDTAPVPRWVARVREQFDQFLPRVRQVIHQAQARVLEGQKVPADAKILRLFAPHTRVIPRFKGGAAVEFGRTVVFDEVEGGIVSRFPVLEEGGTEHDELGRALTHHQAVCGHPPRLVTGDRGLHSPDNERLARAAGVRHLVIPSGGKVSPQQRAHEKDRTWRRHYRIGGAQASRAASIACIAIMGSSAVLTMALMAWSVAWAGAFSPATSAISASRWWPATNESTSGQPEPMSALGAPPSGQSPCLSGFPARPRAHFAPETSTTPCIAEETPP